MQIDDHEEQRHSQPAAVQFVMRDVVLVLIILGVTVTVFWERSRKQ
jgi:hypothetical protein